MITLRTLGEALIDVDARPVAPDADRLFALLVLLAAEPGRALPRDQVAAWLWPAAARERGFHCLRQTLYRLRVLGAPVECVRDRLAVAAAAVAPTFAAAPSAARLRAEREAGTLRLGGWLPGYAPDLAPDFAEWLDAQRAIVECAERRALSEVLAEHRRRGEWRDVDALASELLRLDPLHDEATLAFAEAAAMAGAGRDALGVLDRYLAELPREPREARAAATELRRRIAERTHDPDWPLTSSTRTPAAATGTGSDDEVPLAGRERLIQTLLELLRRAGASAPQGVMLSGAPGVGKSRVAREVAAVARLRGWRVVAVRCAEADRRRPMAACADLAAALLRLPGALGCAPESLVYLRRLVGDAALDTRPSEAARAAPALAGRLRAAVVDVVDAVAGERPLLIHVEDAQHLDSASEATLRDAVSTGRARAVLVLMTAARAPTGEGASVPGPSVPGPFSAVAVPPLERAAATDVVRRTAARGGGALSAEAEAWCVDVGEGNPFFLRELALHRLRGDGDVCGPPSVRELLHRRLGGLEACARRVLQVITLLGTHVSPERLAAVLELSTHRLADALDALARGGVLAAGDGPLAVRHALVADAALAELSGPARRLLHHRVAAVLDAEAKQHGGLPLLWAAVEHWLAAGESRRAAASAASVAARLLELGAPRDAAEVLRRALATAPAADAAAVRIRLGEALLIAGDSHGAFQVLDVAVAEAAVLRRAADGAAGDGMDRATHGTHRIGTNGAAPVRVASVLGRTTPDAEAALLHVEAGWRVGRPWPRLLECARAVTADAAAPASVRLRGVLLAVALAENAATCEPLDDVGATLERLAETRGIDPALVLRARTIYHVSAGDLREGVRAGGALAELLLARDVGPAELLPLQNAAEALREGGAVARAAELLHRAFDAAARCSAAPLAARAADRLASIALDAQDVAAAERWAEQSRRWAAVCDGEQTAWDVADTGARLSLARGDSAVAVRLAHDMLRRAARAPGATPRLWRAALTTAAEAHLAAGLGPLRADILAGLVGVHRWLAERTGHDRTAAAAAAALARSGDAASAAALASHYLSHQRRALGGVPEPLARYAASSRAPRLLPRAGTAAVPFGVAADRGSAVMLR